MNKEISISPKDKLIHLWEQRRVQLMHSAKTEALSGNYGKAADLKGKADGVVFCIAMLREVTW